MHIIGNVIEEIKKIKNNSQDLIFTDPPYNLGSTWFVNKNGQPEVKVKADFMNKWQGLTSNDLESMFKNFFRILKYGGYCIFAGQARQVMAFQYYAIKAGFDMIEPIYSYNISNFPKSLNVSKALDKHFGEEREVIRKTSICGTFKQSFQIEQGYRKKNENNGYKGEREGAFVTAPASDLAKKYDGIHSSICPLKQTTEIWNIFRKPFKHKTIVKDILAYEDGDETIHPSGINIEEGRIPTSDKLGGGGENEKNSKDFGILTDGFDRPWRHDIEHRKKHAEKIKENVKHAESTGRYPSQLFLDGLINYKREDIDLKDKDFLSFIGIDPDVIKFMDTDKALDYVCSHLDKFDVSKLLDDQSGILTSGDKKPTGKSVYGGNSFNKSKTKFNVYSKGDSGGCSRILHKASFVLPELYQHIYYSKPSNYERNVGCDNFEEKQSGKWNAGGIGERRKQAGQEISRNNHPTLKSLKLLYLIIQLFKTPDHEKQKVLIPFSGVSSEKIAFLAHGYLDENITSIEISKDYSDIGQARELFWKEHNYFFKDDKNDYNKNKEVIKNNDNETRRLF